MQAQSKEGHINKGNIREKNKDRVQQPKKKKESLKEIGKEKGGRRRKKQETV